MSSDAVSLPPDDEDVARFGGRLFAEHPALGVTLGYLLISLLGLSYQWTLFHRFDVNFFLYAEVTDFLMGAFREPVTFVLSLSALAIGWVVHLYTRWELGWWRRHPPKNWLTRGYTRMIKASFNRYAPAFFFVVYSVMFIWLYADKHAEALEGGEGHAVRLEVAEGQARRPGPDEPTLMMGTSARFVFLYRPGSGLVEIVPHENVSRIVVGETAPAAAPPAPARASQP